MYEKDKYLRLKINFMNCTVDIELALCHGKTIDTNFMCTRDFEKG